MTETAIATACGIVPRNTLLELRFPSRVDRIKLIRPGVAAAAAMCGLEPAVARDVVLAVDEACQNVIVHGYKGRDDGDIVLTLMCLDEAFLVELRDRAPPIDPTKIKHRALHDLRPGKLGSYFMNAIMDRIEYLPGPNGGNLIRMFKRKDGSS